MKDQFVAEEEQMAAEAEPEVAAVTEYIEYAGDPQYGTAFLSSHTITKGDALWKRNNVTVPKDLVWERDPSVPIGRKSPMRVPVSDIPAEALPFLENLDGFKRVTA